LYQQNLTFIALNNAIVRLGLLTVGVFMVAYEDILHARERIKPYILPTPVEPAPGIGASVWLKLENVNRTHSFKIRGALNALLSLENAARKRGIVTSSSGNHAQGVAYAASVTGTRARILMPPHTPKRKVSGVQRYGAEAVLYGQTYDDVELEARRIEREQGYIFISPYNDPLVVAGAGTIGLEILEALPDVERVLVCVGGGGLISGIATALKSMKPTIEVIGVCAEGSPALYNYFYDTQLPQDYDTIAQALSGEIEMNSITLEIARRYVDDVVLVSEGQILEAMRWLLYEQGWLVEGGGAVGVAAMLNGIVPVDTRRTVIVISGGNIDRDKLQPILCY
jgi:threonine dehydratase